MSGAKPFLNAVGQGSPEPEKDLADVIGIGVFVGGNDAE